MTNIYRWNLKDVNPNLQKSLDFSTTVSAVKSEAMNKRFCCAGQYRTELQEQLSEANNKISRIFLVCPLFSYYNCMGVGVVTFAPVSVAVALRKKPPYLPKCGPWRRNWKTCRRKWQCLCLIMKIRYHVLMKPHGTSDFKFDIWWFGGVHKDTHIWTGPYLHLKSLTRVSVCALLDFSLLCLFLR